MKKVVFLSFILLSAAISMAQESQTAYNFLRLPASAHGAALGGENISLIEDDASLMFANPALLTNVSDKTINLNYMNYMHGVSNLSAAYNMWINERAVVAASAQLVDYGSMKEFNAEGVQNGTFHAKDIALSGYLGYQMNDYLSGGVTAKLITSYIGNYSSMAVGIDLGLNYFRNDWSFSAVAKNLGGQIEAFNDDYEAMPVDLQVGVSKRLTGSPLRLNVSLVDLVHGVKPKEHLVFGADLILSQSIWVGMGYNFRRANEMEIGTGDDRDSHWAGLSLGGGINLERFKVNVAWGKYHVASSSILINIAYTL